MKKEYNAFVLLFIICLTALTMTACKESHTHTFDQEVAAEDYFAFDDVCIGKTSYYYYSCACGEKGTETFSVDDGAQHLYGKPFYAWNGNQCIATRICERNSAHIDMEMAIATYILDSVATCTTPEKGHYKVEFNKDAFEDQETGANKIIMGEELGHNYSDWNSNGDGTHTKICDNEKLHVITKDCEGGKPTCTEKAICSDCKTAYGDPNGHDYESLVTKPTYSEKGYTTYTCYCGDTYIDDYVDALNQDYDNKLNQAIKWNNAIIIDFDSQNQNEAFASKSSSTGGWWGAFNTSAKHCIIPISYGMRVKVQANKEYDTDVFFMSAYNTPTNSNSPFNVVEIVSVVKNTTREIAVPYGSRYVVVNVMAAGNQNRMPQAMSIEFDEEFAEIYLNAKTKDVSVQFGEPITILSNIDKDATPDEKLKLSYFNIVQLSDKMYYLYYAAYGDGPIEEYNQNLLFAYSTDGINYTRGFPDGITAPYVGTNKIFSNAEYTNFTGQNIFKCLDPEYPWRMVFQQRASDGENNVYMIKSKDGIHFEQSTKRMLQSGVITKEVNGITTKVKNLHDTQYGVVCRGNTIKFFSRQNVNYTVNGVTHKSREISVTYFDLDGNILSPEKNLPLKYVYNSASIPLDDRYEIIIPTGFDDTKVNGVSDQSYTLNMYTVDGYLVNEIESNISSIIEKDDLWINFAPSMITIGNTQYLAFKTANITHETSPTLGTTVFKYKIVPIKIVRE